MTEGSGSLSSVGSSAVWRGQIDGVICFQNTLLRLRPREGIADGRFLSWWVRSALASGLFASIATGANIHHLSAERVRSLPLNLPSLDEQRQIADFLDAETIRIEYLRGKREQQLDIVSERERSAVSELFSSAVSAISTPFKRLLTSRPRYGVLVPEFVDYGVPFIRVNDLVELDERVSRLRSIPLSLSAKYRTTVVREGDILLSVVGTLGRAAIAGSRVAGANVARAVAVVRVNNNVNRSLMLAWLRGDQFERQALLATGTDSAQPTLGMEDLANFSIRWPQLLEEQQKMAEDVANISAEAGNLNAKLNRQISLLVERRRALITAAVTGQIDVTTARGAEL